MINKVAQTVVRNEIIVNISALINEIIESYRLSHNKDKYLSLKYSENRESLSAKQYWIVSDWLGDKLKDRGEIIKEITTFMVWGRTVDDQPLENDEIIQEISKIY